MALLMLIMLAAVLAVVLVTAVAKVQQAPVRVRIDNTPRRRR